jgi:signal transduction histidine kinase
MRETLTDRQGRPLKRISLQKRVELRRLYVAEMPMWRRPLVGYLFTIPTIGLGLLALLLEPFFLTTFYFASTFLLVTTLLVALFWGVGPALFSVVLGTISLYYFYVSPVIHSSIPGTRDILQLLPYIIAGLVVAIITAQRETARYRALFAEEVANERADELARANFELEQANKLKDQFLSMASHELKTPITSIRGQAQLALRRIAKQREVSSDISTAYTSLEKIEQQTRRLDALVEDLLDLSSIQAGKIPLQMSKCDLVEICRAVVEEQRLLSGRTIALDIPPEPVKIRADANRLSQVVTNLVSNALKYSPDNKPVSLRLSQEGDGKITIAVEDEGSGIAQEEQEHIFEPFYRASHARSSSKNGMGLGLAICKDIVERHGGSIWCDSHPGKGSSFFVRLPQD